VTLGGKRYVVLGSSQAVTAGSEAKLTIPISRRTARHLKRQRKLRLVVRIVATDAAANQGLAVPAFNLRAH
jgi:hypothetical protein